MNIIPKNHLVNALTVYKSTFGTNELIAVEVKDDKCRLDVNNDLMSLRISFNVDHQSNSASQLVMEVDRLLGFLKGSPADVLTIDTKKSHILTLDQTKLSIPKSNLKIMAWGLLPTKINVTTITSANLFAQIAKTLMPFSSGGHHNVLDSICIRRKKNELELIGTDGFRVGVVHITDHCLTLLNDIDVIVPNNILTVLTKLVKSDEECSIFVTDKLFRMEVKYNELLIEAVVALITSPYPNIGSLLHALPDHEWELNATDLVRYCNLHKTVENNKKTANATFVLRGNTIEMTGTNGSDINSVIGAVTRVQGTEDRQATLSLRFILDAVNLIILNGSERIRFGICSATNLIWFRADSKNKSVKTMAVVVPMV